MNEVMNVFCVPDEVGLSNLYFVLDA